MYCKILVQSMHVFEHRLVITTILHLQIQSMCQFNHSSTILYQQVSSLNCREISYPNGEATNSMTRHKLPKPSLGYLRDILTSSNLENDSRVKGVVCHDAVHCLGVAEQIATQSKMLTCLPHLMKAEGGTLPGAICSRTLPVALNRGITSMNTATETIPRHNTSAFSILEQKRKRKCLAKTQTPSWYNKRAKESCQRIYPNERNQEASIKPALEEREREIPDVN